MRCLFLLWALLYLFFGSVAAAGTCCCAHRGDNKNAPENTLPAFELAVNKGAHQIEFDVQRTKDGRLIIMHDSRVDRTTDGSGKVGDMTFEEIRALDAGGWFSPGFAGVKVPTLEETLSVIPRTVLCNVHLKGDNKLGAEVAAAIAALDRLDHCFLACTLEQAREAKAVVPEIKICNMSRQGFNRALYVDSTIEYGAEFIQLSHANGMAGLAAFVGKLHEHGVTVNWFGASEEAPVRALVDAGIDYILTDDLDLCLAVVGEYGVKPLEHTEQGETAH